MHNIFELDFIIKVNSDSIIKRSICDFGAILLLFYTCCLNNLFWFEKDLLNFTPTVRKGVLCLPVE